jgi:hypothetical protein
MYRWRIPLQTAGSVIAILIAKVIIEQQQWDFIEINTLFGSVIAGGIFLISMILAGTMSDYKECERIPAEIVSALENIYDEGVQASRKWPSFDLAALREALIEIVDAFHADLTDVQGRRCLAAINRLSEQIAQLEELGQPANYIVRLKGEQSTIRRLVLRVYHVQRTNFVPSAYILVDSVIVLIIGLLLFAQYETKVMPVFASVLLTGFISYLFLYMIRLLRTLDQPFRVNEQTMDDVSRFLLKEFRERMEAEAGVPVKA